MTDLVFLLEEPSAREMLKGVLPKLLADNNPVFTPYFLVFEGKQDLEKQMPGKIRGWRNPHAFFVVLRDQDKGDCLLIKHHLRTRAADSGRAENILIRIACCELESFYLGDLAAVASGLGVPGLGRLQTKSQYRDPDRLTNAAEQLYKITAHQYQKVAGSRAIAPYLRIDGSNTSRSFNALLQGIRRLALKAHPLQ